MPKLWHHLPKWQKFWVDRNCLPYRLVEKAFYLGGGAVFPVRTFYHRYRGISPREELNCLAFLRLDRPAKYWLERPGFDPSIIRLPVRWANHWASVPALSRNSLLRDPSFTVDSLSMSDTWAVKYSMHMLCLSTHASVFVHKRKRMHKKSVCTKKYWTAHKTDIRQLSIVKEGSLYTVRRIWFRKRLDFSLFYWNLSLTVDSWRMSDLCAVQYFFCIYTDFLCTLLR